MNKYQIKIYHDKTNRVITYDGFVFSDKDAARMWGNKKASHEFPREYMRDETSVHVVWLETLK